MMFRVTYILEEGTNLYRVRLHAINQTIVLPKGFLVKTIGMDSRCSVGCKEITVHEIMALGFILPSEIDRLIV